VQSVWDAGWHLGRGKARDEGGGPESFVKDIGAAFSISLERGKRTELSGRLQQRYGYVMWEPGRISLHLIVSV
jgi:hypothetical protein